MEGAADNNNIKTRFRSCAGDLLYHYNSTLAVWLMLHAHIYVACVGMYV